MYEQAVLLVVYIRVLCARERQLSAFGAGDSILSQGERLGKGGIRHSLRMHQAVRRNAGKRPEHDDARTSFTKNDVLRRNACLKLGILLHQQYPTCCKEY